MTEGIELQSIVESHDRPFLVIDRDFNVVAMNRAYRKAFHVAGQVQLGRKCFSVIHHREHPCYELGEDCPYLRAYLTHQPHSCLHTHYDEQGRERRVRVKLYPLIGSDGTLYMGEMLQEITARGDEQPRDSARPVGRSPAFLYAMEQLEQAARADAPVLLLGETGTGKELAAHFVHHQSQRRLRPFIAVDCAVLTEQLFESELFGHERGAFTGSVRAKPGLIEAAQGGTLFLDEIGEASPAMQAKLLRVLETGEYRRLGSTKVMKSDTRIVCATNRHLWEEVKRGTFREDLYYRIAVFCIRVPPLRERAQDIPLLAQAMLEEIGRQAQRSYRLSRGAVRYLAGQHYPGNARELRNVLQVAAFMTAPEPRATIRESHLRQSLRMKQELEGGVARPPAATAEDAEPRSTGQESARAPMSRHAGRPHAPGAAQVQPCHSLKEAEARHIETLLEHYGGHRQKVASALGISERTLYRKLRRYSLKAP